MAPIVARDAEIHIATTSGGTYTCIAQSHTFTDRRGATGDTKFYVFCDDTPLVEAGSDDATFDINFLLDLDDTNGQNVVRDAFEDKSTIYLRILYDGTRGRQQPFTVTSYQVSGDANGTGLGRYVAGTATFTSAGASTEITGS